MFVGELTFPITQIKGVGKVTAADFASLGVEKACDLVTLFPRSYDDRTVMRSLKDMGDEGGTINTAVAITDHSHYMSKGQRVLKMTARDLNSGRTLHLHCFGRSFMENAYPVGTSWFINATVTKTGSVFSASAFTLGASEEAVGIGTILPVYPLSGSLTQKTVRKAVDTILSNRYMKFDDEVSSRNFSSLRWEDINVKPTLTSNGVRMEWNLINGNNCYYQVSIFAEGDEDEPYFVSQLLEGDNLDITMTTTGVVNRLNELKYGTPCKARLAVIMLEDGVPHNDVYATNNLQAVLYATSSGTFSPEF